MGDRRAREVLRWIVVHVMPEWKAYIGNILLTLLRANWPVAAAWNVSLFIDSAARADLRGLLFALGSGFLIYGGMALTDAFLQMLRYTVYSTSAHLIRTKTLSRSQRARMTALGRFSEGNIASRIIDDSDNATNLLQWQAVNALIAPVQGASAFIYLLTLNRRIAVMAAVMGPFVALLFWAMARLAARGEKELRDGEASLGHFVQDTWAGAIVVRCFQLARHAGELFAQRTREVFGMHLRLARIYGLGFGSLLAVVGGVEIAAMYFGLKAIEAGGMSAGELVAALSLVQVLQLSFASLGEMWSEVQRSFVCADRTLEMANLEQEEEGSPAEAVRAGPIPVAPEIRFDHVWFSYDEAASSAPTTLNANDPHHVLRDVSFVVPAGTSFALIGPSGSGKTTVLRLLLGLYRPSSGRILLDGVDTGSIPLASVRKAIAYVAQDGYLFQGTVESNILLGNQRATEEGLRNVLRLARLDRLVSARAEDIGVETGERGGKLSGGEVQRVSLARAILKDAPVVLLDEFTSSLDSESERAIQENLAVLFKGKTSIVIAHRLSTARLADRVAVLEGNRITEMGTRAELLRSNGYYARLSEAFGNRETTGC